MKTNKTLAAVMSMAAVALLPFTAKAQTSENGFQLQGQEQDEQAWENNKWFSVGYVADKLTAPDFSVKGSWGLALQTGKTYWLTKPIAGSLRIGLDAVWCDANYVNYKKFSPLEDLDWPYGDSYGDYKDYFDEYDLGHHRLDIGMGVGVQAAYMPFLSSNGALRHLRASVYFRFTPSYSALIQSYDGESEFAHGFTPFFNCGATVQYRSLALGVEGRWGTGKFSTTDFTDDYSSSKLKYKSSSLRVFLSFCF